MTTKKVIIFDKEIECSFNHGLMGRVLGVLANHGVKTTIKGIQEFLNSFKSDDFGDIDLGKNYQVFTDLAKQFDPDFNQSMVDDMDLYKLINYHSQIIVAVTELLINKDPIEASEVEADSNQKKSQAAT